MKAFQCLAASAFSVSMFTLGCSPDSGRDLVSPQLDLADASSGPAANGHGNWINPTGEYVSRTFHAVTKKDGIVEGNFVQHVTALTGEKRVNKSDIDCLRLLGPNDAIMSGRITEQINPALIGRIQIFRVQDDGEGSDAVDKISILLIQPALLPMDCNSLVLPPDVSPIESGNIQVKP